jgi:hypothetical protein
MVFLSFAIPPKINSPCAALRLRWCCMRVFPSILLALAFASVASAQSPPAAPIDAASLMRRAVQHQMDADKSHHPMRYLVHKTDARRDTTKQIVETADGDVARLVAIDDKPLSPEADRAELDRLDTLAAHPEMQQRRHRSEQKDAARVSHLLSLLPEAFLYRYDGVVPCSSGQCLRLSFTPNPRFTPPDLESNMLRGIAGEMWVDPAQERLARLDGHFIADVDFGFGIIGKLNKGGKFFLELTDVGGRDWELTRLALHVNGRALLVKSLSFQIDEEASRFAPVPPGLKYRDAIQLLKKSPLN